ncbi:MAG: 4Fe-4S dicluster domain-containing protein [Acidobacteriota bacterium]|jgi:electron transport protein HydN
MNILVIADPGKCIGCRTCEVACVLAHAAPDAIHKLAAAHFIPRLKLIKTSKVSTPVQCRQCEDAPCAKVCPTRALVLNHNSVQVVQTRCIGCKSCVMACPYGAMEIVTRVAVLQERQPAAGGPLVEAYKCDLCIHRPQGPSCIEVCPTKAIYTIDAKVLSDNLRKKREQAAVAQM